MSLLTDYLALTKLPAKQTLTATANGQASFATAGYTPGLVNVFIGGSRLDPGEYTATDGINIVITNSDVLTQITTGMTIDVDNQFSSTQTGPVSVSTITNAVQTQVLTPLAAPSGSSLIGFTQNATSATAGTASTLPATPAGYLAVTVDGVLRKIPYYNI
jgi:hypothetical protein